MRLDELVHYLAFLFTTAAYPPEEQGGIYHSHPDSIDQPVRRIGLALEPWPGLPDWLVENRIDTLWLHRPWHLDPAVLPENTTVLAHHLPFDEHFTIGYNRSMAEAVGLPWTVAEGPEPIGYKQAPGLPPRPIGMLGRSPQLDLESWRNQIIDLFGGYEEAYPGRQSAPDRIAVVGAMTDALIREASDRGAGLYITGQYRKGAQRAVDATGLTVIAIGHRRSEEWGLRKLADLLRAQGLICWVA
ncbi:Nif3-like dinuclear metal center hexameric protein [Larkinella terrae]|nr:Nif3-like dinuclear metal center hexameric protein [Larkinella terrae]